MNLQKQKNKVHIYYIKKCLLASFAEIQGNLVRIAVLLKAIPAYLADIQSCSLEFGLIFDSNTFWFFEQVSFVSTKANTAFE